MGGSGKFRALSKVQVVKGGKTACGLQGKAASYSIALLLAIDEQMGKVETKVEDMVPRAQETYKDSD